MISLFRSNLLRSNFPAYIFHIKFWNSLMATRKICFRECKLMFSHTIRIRTMNFVMIRHKLSIPICRSTPKSVLQQMIKKNQDYFSICKPLTSEVSLQQSRVEDLRNQEKCRAIKKLKKMEETLAKGYQENNQLKIHQKMLSQQLQEKKCILRQNYNQLCIEDKGSLNGRTDKKYTHLQDFSFKASHKAAKGSLLHNDNSQNTLEHKYSQRYCTVMPTPKDQSPSRRHNCCTKDTYYKKSYPQTLLSHPQKCYSQKISRNLACNKTQRKNNCKENCNIIKPKEKSSFGFVSIEDIWNEEMSFSSSKYWKSTAKTISD